MQLPFVEINKCYLSVSCVLQITLRQCKQIKVCIKVDAQKLNALLISTNLWLKQTIDNGVLSCVIYYPVGTLKYNAINIF